MSEPRFYRRTFLNREQHHAGAYILANVTRTRRSDDAARTAGVELTITDCKRQINLDFPMWVEADRANSAAKARLLADVLAGFAAAVEKEARLADERDARERRQV